MNDLDEIGQEYIEDIQRVAEKLGKPPSMIEYTEHGNWASQTIADKFGRWNIAIKEAGFEPYPRTTIPSKEELKADIQRVGTKVGGQPTNREMWEHGEYGLHIIKKKFESWRFALYEAGYEGALPVHMYLHENGPSTLSDLPREPGFSDKVEGVTGFKFPDSSAAESVYYIFNEHSKEDVVRVAIRANKEIIENQYNIYRISITLGTTKGKEWADAFKNVRKELNLNLDRGSDNQYSTEELVSELRQMSVTNEITISRLRNECSASVATFTNRFGGIERINLIAAGVIDLEDTELHE